MASETNPIMQRRASCDFPALYVHTIPSTFNVYFIPSDGSATIEYANIGTGKSVFEVPATKYRVVVTNSTAKDRYSLPLYSEVLFLYGENTVDFATAENVDVTVTNGYSSIMVVKNKTITTVPKFAGVALYDFGTYYNIYYRSESGIATGELGLNDYTKKVAVEVKANEVHRFMMCPEDGLNIIVDSNILAAVSNTIIVRKNG